MPPAEPDQNVKAVAPQRIILFGSYTYGQPNSDVDLLVVMESNERPTARGLCGSPGCCARAHFRWTSWYMYQDIQDRLEIGDYLLAYKPKCHYNIQRPVWFNVDSRGCFVRHVNFYCH